ncbi:C2H2-type domain-containing protein [Meloidogyne graminicola]|uniref:C2H2-type domain-containing protein n=1 Tax=Meloidogyne graminicola TaxID=189291 RepID=A0A8T0A0M9_9BILA|nr:C2H2-type domain-containing protein [Meloidogyne graminicola]
MDQFHSNLLLLQCQRFKASPQPFDCAIRVFVSDENGSKSKEHLLFAHSQIISNKSIPLRAQLDQQTNIALTRFLLLLQAHEENYVKGFAANGALNNFIREIKLDLSALQNGFEAFKLFITFLYGDQSAVMLNNANVSEQLILLSKLFSVPDLEMCVRSATILNLLGSHIGGNKLELSACNTSPGSSEINTEQLASFGKINKYDAPSLASIPLYAAYLQMQQKLLFLNPSSSNTFIQNSAELQTTTQPEHIKQHPFAALFHDKLPRSDSDNDNNIGEDFQSNNNQELQHSIMTRRESNTSLSSSSINSSLGNENNSLNALNEGGSAGGDLLLPPNDKEGWCRNKKYIQIVKMGFRCLLCNKVYGRYNSVSYHVTIYHRNPPIRCEEQGCQFTTREARYIHFHKYYRHQIALPESIDLASRKCPLIGCKHVSKSPAMLEKHMQRHVADCLKEGGSSSNIYVCRMPVITKDENMDSLENNDPEILKSLKIVKSMKERRNTFSGCSGSVIGSGGQCLFKANSRELMYSHLLNCHSASSLPTNITTLSADAEKQVGGEEDEDKERLLGGGKISASAPNTPPLSNPHLFSPLLSRFPCNECNFRGRTVTSLTNHKLQKHCNVNKNISQKQQNIGKHLPPTKCSSSFMLPFNSSLFNYGIFANGGSGGFSLPGSPYFSTGWKPWS